MRISASGAVGIGIASTGVESLKLGGICKGLGVGTYGIRAMGTVPSTATVVFSNYDSVPNTQAATFTIASFNHFRAVQGTIGAGSAVTTQYGFSIDGSLTGATNNYGFYGGIASATGRYNLYMAGTADNYLAGKLTVANSITITGAFALRGSYGAGAITSNFAAGDNALVSNTTGYNNSAVGVQALLNNTTGYNNSAVGAYALQSNTTGISNSAVGTSALQSNTTGSSNSAVGVQALLNNTTGTSNSAIGLNALLNNTTGYNNSAIGLQALQSNTTGTSNSAVGAYALLNNTTGYNNSAIGLNALLNNTTGYNNSAIGLNALQSNTTGIKNSAVGAYALYSNTTGTSNSAIGLNALYSNTTGNYNSAVGAYALQSNTTGISNSAVGTSALYSNTTGYYNSAVGTSALQSNTTGISNSAVGTDALQDLATTTIAATAIVNGTAYQIVTMGTTTSAQWIASGAVTGKIGETFTANATAGVGTGTVATSANIATQCLNNTALGKSSGRGITTGSGNTILGANVTGLAAGLTNNVIIANGTGSIRVQSNATTITFADVILPPQAVTASAPAYVKGGMYFDTTLNKMRIGGATAWETVTSI
jgi:hypothetical protein